LTKKLYGKLALLDYGNEPFQVKGDKYSAYGANMAIRRELFDTYGCFQTNIGRVKDKLFSGEDTVWIDTILRKGLKMIYQPEMSVYHRIPAERMKKSYFRKWHFYVGISSANIAETETVRKLLFDIPRYKVRYFLITVMDYFSSLILFLL